MIRDPIKQRALYNNLSIFEDYHFNSIKVKLLRYSVILVVFYCFSFLLLINGIILTKTYNKDCHKYV